MKQEELVILELGFLATAPFFVSSLRFSSTTASLLDSMALLFSFAVSGSFGVNLLSSAKRPRVEACNDCHGKVVINAIHILIQPLVARIPRIAAYNPDLCTKNH